MLLHSIDGIYIEVASILRLVCARRGYWNTPHNYHTLRNPSPTPTFQTMNPTPTPATTPTWFRSEWAGMWCKCTLTHWGRVAHMCVSKRTIIGSDNGLSPGRHQAIIWTNAGILLIRMLGTNFSEVLIEIITFLFKKMRLKVSSAKRRSFFSAAMC